MPFKLTTNTVVPLYITAGQGEGYRFYPVLTIVYERFQVFLQVN